MFISLGFSIFKYTYWGAKCVASGAPAGTICSLAIKSCIEDIKVGNTESVACKIALTCGLPATGIGVLGVFVTPRNAKLAVKSISLGYKLATSPYQLPAMGLDYLLGEVEEAVFGHRCPASSWSPSSDASSFSSVLADHFSGSSSSS